MDVADLGDQFGCARKVVGAHLDRAVAITLHVAADAGMAVILLDVEGEYTFLHEPTDNAAMRSSGRSSVIGMPATVV